MGTSLNANSEEDLVVEAEVTLEKNSEDPEVLIKDEVEEEDS